MNRPRPSVECRGPARFAARITTGKSHIEARSDARLRHGSTIEGARPSRSICSQGDHDQFYFSPPQPRQVTLFLEKQAWNTKPCRWIPAGRTARAGPGAELTPGAGDRRWRTVVFDSNAILLYLAEKTGQFMPADTAGRGQMYSWLMFVASGIGPFGGQAVHFKHYARAHYSISRYDFEAWRHYFASSTNTSQDHRVDDRQRLRLVDAWPVWGWARAIALRAQRQALDELPHVKRLLGRINARPRRSGALRSGPFQLGRMDDGANKACSRQNARLPA